MLAHFGIFPASVSPVVLALQPSAAAILLSSNEFKLYGFRAIIGIAKLSHWSVVVRDVIVVVVIVVVIIIIVVVSIIIRIIIIIEIIILQPLGSLKLDNGRG